MSLPGPARRAREREALATPPPGRGGGFDVRPAHVYSTSYRLRDEQFTYNDGARHLLHALAGHEQIAGRGEGADAFAHAYAKVAARFLEVWAKSVVSVGGAAVGLTVTANNYAAADWFTNQKQYGPPPRQQPPAVISSPPHYGTVPDLAWRGTGQDSGSSVVRALGHIPDFLAGHVEKAIDEGLRLGRMYEITPGPDKDGLRKVAAAWKDAGTAALKAGDRFTDAVAYITDGRNSEWQDAMRAFCQTIWGTTAWGGTRYGHGQDWRTNADVAPRDRRPILTVLHHTALAVEKACHDVVDAVTKVTDVSEPAAIRAAKAMIKDMIRSVATSPLRDLADLTPFGAVDLTAQMVMSFRSHMDYDAIAHAVATYHETCHTIATALDGLLPALDEALLSAPTFQSEDARAEGFGARSLNEFKHAHPWTNKGDVEDGRYRIDLASSEGLDGSHTLDKHVGKTDAQLAQRLRDDLKKPPRPGSSWPYGQPRIGNASTFRDVESAQRLTQYCIDKNSRQIKEWLASEPSPGDDFDINVKKGPDNSPSGRSIDRQDYRTSGLQSVTKAKDVYGVETRLKYDPDLIPPFVVLSSMPKDPPAKPGS